MPTDIAPDTTHSEEDGQSHCSLLFRPSRAYEAFERGASAGIQAKGPESTGHGGAVKKTRHPTRRYRRDADAPLRSRSLSRPCRGRPCRLRGSRHRVVRGASTGRAEASAGGWE